jgi:hypothetical protein
MFLTLFAICTFGLGFFVGITVQMFHHGTPTLLSSNGPANNHWDRYSLELSAAAVSSRVATTSFIFFIVSWLVLAAALASRSDQGLVCVLARTLYVLSFVAMMAAISSAVLFCVV